jgi:peptidoglycan hydrolase-like protein with peptidoglycan-binding domain
MATPLLLSQLRQAANPPPPLGDDPIARLASGGAVDPASTGGIGTAGGSELVRQIQSRLAEARVADLKPDGILGERTRAAIRTFQALESLDVTGEPSEEVLARLSDTGASAMR